MAGLQQHGSLEWQEWATCVTVHVAVVAVSFVAVLASLATVCGMVADKRDLRSTRDRLLLGLLLANALYVNSTISISTRHCTPNT